MAQRLVGWFLYGSCSRFGCSITRNGLLESTKGKTDANDTTYSYDGLGRQVAVVHPRTGASETHYNSLGQMDWVEDAANNRTLYEYYDGTTVNAGRLKSVTSPAIPNTATAKQSFEYTARGELFRNWGNGTHPVEYQFDNLGRKTEMHTYRGGGPWGGTSWPSGTTGAADVTAWVYEPGSSLLLEKRYHDHTPQNPRNIEYQYTVEGRLSKRIWSRKIGDDRLATSYGYSAATGELTTIDYLYDDTPTVTFTYDRVGRRKTITDASGTRTLVYRNELDPNKMPMIKPMAVMMPTAAIP